jgi:hypothetical protein
MKKRSLKGISFIEYTITVVACVAVLLAIQVCVSRAVCGRWRQSADVFGFGRQYDAQKTTTSVSP